MPLKLYKLDPSPVARAAMMACDIFHVPVEMVDVDLFTKEHLTPEYLKKNPLHTVPVLEDRNLYLHDSHAILAYLADAYGKDDSWYPKDVKKRALVNQKLFFESGVLFPRLRNVSYYALLKGQKKVQKFKVEEIEEAYSFVEEFLNRHKYIAGDNITIADLSAYATITCLVYIVPLDAKKFPKTQLWISELETQPFSKKHNEPGAKCFGENIVPLLEFE